MLDIIKKPEQTVLSTSNYWACEENIFEYFDAIERDTIRW